MQRWINQVEHTSSVIDWLIDSIKKFEVNIFPITTNHEHSSMSAHQSIYYFSIELFSLFWFSDESLQNLFWRNRSMLWKQWSCRLSIIIYIFCTNKIIEHFICVFALLKFNWTICKRLIQMKYLDANTRMTFRTNAWESFTHKTKFHWNKFYLWPAQTKQQQQQIQEISFWRILGRNFLKADTESESGRNEEPTFTNHFSNNINCTAETYKLTRNVLSYFQRNGTFRRKQPGLWSLWHCVLYCVECVTKANREWTVERSVWWAVSDKKCMKWKIECRHNHVAFQRMNHNEYVCNLKNKLFTCISTVYVAYQF